MSKPKNQLPLVYDPENWGREMKEMSVDTIQTSKQKVKSRWFHSKDYVDLFVWTDELGNIIKQQLSFCGQVVEWNIVDGVKTGYVLEEDSTRYTPEQESICFDEKLQKTSVDQALKLVAAIEVLNESEKNLIQKHFQNSPTIDTMSNHELMTKYNKHTRAIYEVAKTNSFLSYLYRIWSFFFTRK